MKCAADRAKQIRKFTVSGLLELTGICAVSFALIRWLGLELSFSLLVLAYAFAPALALLAIHLMARYQRHVRYGAAAVILLFFAALMTMLCGLRFGEQAVPVVVVGTLIEWPGQLAVLVCLRLLWTPRIRTSLTS